MAEAPARMLPGERMVTQVARQVMLDNAADIKRTYSHCDLSQPSQVTRFEALNSLEDQQLDKAHDLNRRLKEDAAGRQVCSRIRGHGRKSADARVAGCHVALAKFRERGRAIQHELEMERKFPNKPTLVLTVQVRRMAGQSLEIDCVSMDGEGQLHLTMHRDSLLSELTSKLTHHFRHRTLDLVNSRGVCITKLCQRYLVRDIPCWHEDEIIEESEDHGASEDLSEGKPRNMKRKPDPPQQRKRKSANRSRNKRLKAEKSQTRCHDESSSACAAQPFTLMPLKTKAKSPAAPMAKASGPSK